MVSTSVLCDAAPTTDHEEGGRFLETYVTTLGRVSGGRQGMYPEMEGTPKTSMPSGTVSEGVKPILYQGGSWMRRRWGGWDQKKEKEKASG